MPTQLLFVSAWFYSVVTLHGAHHMRLHFYVTSRHSCVGLASFVLIRYNVHILKDPRERMIYLPGTMINTQFLGNLYVCHIVDNQMNPSLSIKIVLSIQRSHCLLLTTIFTKLSITFFF